MGMKVDREAVAGLVLPQLWMMSMGPRKRIRSRRLNLYAYLLCSSQHRPVQQIHEVSLRSQCLATLSTQIVCSVIKSLGARVEREHIEHLRAVRKSEAQTASLGMQNSGWELGQESAEVDFETLVGRSSTNTPLPLAGSAGSPSLMDDWGSDMAWLQPKADPVPVSCRRTISK